jgi:hypothetical protein
MALVGRTVWYLRTIPHCGDSTICLCQKSKVFHVTQQPATRTERADVRRQLRELVLECRFHAATGRVISKENGITGILCTLRPPATISKGCPKTGLRNKRRANWCLRFIAQFAQAICQPSFLAPFPPINLVVPQLRCVEVVIIRRIA